ncbi:hypothetical protein CCR94_19905 [Rhodoblastus sphagnicola]|uniref:Acyltransferase 3 domain-containing protein n=1 Tax=Rhodoblastus sphagnicola TaxID=333368 RepID=A0A2S6MYP4_9HYPH|nr:acyltransferase [Rhodoblastus sphagnicola]MBB4196470.1 peptidoglycan/LPS O-acetylase OafA/YrhL [Rhodoblastus sphagnicola]PPQ27495.1 hypothetical protein CCR94_19905 [Rhodoblastus sphagnicola]
MTKNFSLALDALRFLAALCVFLDHLSSAPFTENVIPPRLGAYGDIAVTIFFVLSGFVIAHVVATREGNARDYALSRLSRLYSVVLPALLVTLLADSLGAWLSPDFYAAQKVLWKPVSAAGYASSAFFVNEFQIFGFGGIAPGSNAPFWSLSFEAAYYVLAGLVLFGSRRAQTLAIPALLLCAGPTVAILAPIWALGFALYRVAPPKTPILLAAAALGGFAVILFAPELFGAFDNFGVKFPWGCGAFNRNLAQDYGVALGFAALVLALRGLLGTGPALNPAVERLIRKAGALTFPLYCLHYPILCFVCAESPFGANDPRRALLAAVVALGAAAALTPACERLKAVLRQMRFGRGVFARA